MRVFVDNSGNGEIDQTVTFGELILGQQAFRDVQFHSRNGFGVTGIAITPEEDAAGNSDSRPPPGSDGCNPGMHGGPRHRFGGFSTTISQTVWSGTVNERPLVVGSPNRSSTRCVGSVGPGLA